MRCPKCGASTLKDDYFCGECGENLRRPFPILFLRGRAFTAGHGGHIAIADFVIDPHTNKVEILSIGRLVACDARGRKFGSEKASQSICLSKDEKILYWAALDGSIAEINLDVLGLTTEKTKVGSLREWETYEAQNVNWVELGGPTDNLHCGSCLSPDGRLLYVSSIGSGAVLVYDTIVHEKIGKIPVDAFLTMVQVTSNGYLYGANMAAGIINKVDLKSGEIVGKIDLTAHHGYFLHQGRITPNGRYLWQAAGNEFKEGKPYNISLKGATGVGEGYVIIYNILKDYVVDEINIPGNPQDIAFTKDGRFAIITTREVSRWGKGNLVFVDTTSLEIIATKDICGNCHSEIGADLQNFEDPMIQVLVNLGLLKKSIKGIPLHSGIEIAWEI
jgi:DNA-binding beta-propeller fold protein YncE